LRLPFAARIQSVVIAAEPEMSRATRLDELAALDPLTRREVASAVRRVAAMFAEVRDGNTDSYVLGVLARLLDPA